jgi:hypothetical protein
MPDGSNTPHFQFQGPRCLQPREFPTGCFKKYAAWLNEEQTRDRSVFWLLFEIIHYDPAEPQRPFMWDMRERARAIIEEREPWPEYLLPYRSMRQNAYYHGSRKVEIPTWLNPDNWTDRQRAQARLENEAKRKFLLVRNNKGLYADSDDWCEHMEAAHRELQAVRRRWEEQKRHSFTRAAHIPSIHSLKRRALRLVRR